jgi:hypothetical protein
VIGGGCLEVRPPPSYAFRVRAITAAALVLLALTLGPGAGARPLRLGDNVIVYTPATLPAGAVGAEYDVTMSVVLNGQPADLDTQTTRTTSTQAAPGIFVKLVKVNGRYGLELVGTPTKAGSFTFGTCVNVEANCLDPKSWPLTITGKASPRWVAQARKARADIEKASADEFRAVSRAKDFEYTKALALIERSSDPLDAADDVLFTLAKDHPSGTSPAAFTAIRNQLAGVRRDDKDAEIALKKADRANGDEETKERRAAIHSLDAALKLKYHAEDALERLLP